MRRVALALLALTIGLGIAVGALGPDSRPAFAAAPTVAGVSPSTGPATGGTSVTITGTGFSTCGTLTAFFGTAAASASATSDTSITVTSPPSPLPSPGSGAVDVVVQGTCGPSAISSSDKFTYTAGSGSATIGFSGDTFVVSPDGNDANPCSLAASGGGATTSSFACATIQGAVNKTRDRDQVLVLPGVYDVSQPIEVPDLISIFASANTNGTAMGAGISPYPISNLILANPGAFGGFQPSVCAGIGIKTILRSAGGLPIFHVTGSGSSTLFPIISGFILGGSVSLANPGAIQLDGASYAQVVCNIIGQEDLPNAIGILLRDADNVSIHDNTIHGSSQFPISTSLGPTPPVGGFGIVTSECLGNGHSDDAVIINNVISLNSNAGIYFCGDGAGGHLIIGNTIRGNGRGIALLSTVDVIAAANAIQGNYYNGIELLETSQDNIITNNDIESHDGPNSTGILLEGNGQLFPLDNEIAGNFFRRNSTNIYILGARRTLIGIDKQVSAAIEGKVAPFGHASLQNPGNVMTADGSRTDVVISLGNPNGQSLNSASPGFGQPSDTIIKGNTILSNGPCGATSGCAIRLTAGVIVNIDATQNDWGVTSNDQIRSGIWDKFRDAALGQVVTYCGFGASTPVPGSNITCPATAGLAQPPTVVPYAPPPATTPQPAATVAPAPGFPPAALPVFTPQPASTAPASAPPPPTAYIDPATGNYYVEMTVCVTDSANRPVPNDQLALTLSDAGGGTLGVTTVTTGTNGCFVGDVAATGGAAQVPPATVSITDPSGGVTALAVGAGSPAYRPPAAAITSS